MATRKKTRPTMTEIAKNCENKTLDEIKQYFVDNKIIDTPYIPHEEVAAACSLVMRDACTNEDGKFTVDSDVTSVLSSAYSFFLHTHIDFTGLTYEEIFDIINKYRFDIVFASLYPNITFDPVSAAVSQKVSDMRANEYSTRSLLIELVDSFNKSISELSKEIEANPELVKQYLDK